MNLKEFESHIINSRYDEGNLHKAKRGEYYEIGPIEIVCNIATLREYLDTFTGYTKTFALGIQEFDMLVNNDKESLTSHPFWKGDSEGLLDSYLDLYKQVDENILKSKNEFSRNNIAVGKKSCISLYQKYGKTLMIYQRSSDLSLGYLADAVHIWKIAKDTGCMYVRWYITSAHIYKNNLNNTIKLFKGHEHQKMVFNKRG